VRTKHEGSVHFFVPSFYRSHCTAWGAEASNGVRNDQQIKYEKQFIVDFDVTSQYRFRKTEENHNNPPRILIDLHCKAVQTCYIVLGVPTSHTASHLFTTCAVCGEAVSLKARPHAVCTPHRLSRHLVVLLCPVQQL
jgi:hypothetical protein